MYLFFMIGVIRNKWILQLLLMSLDLFSWVQVNFLG